MGDPVVEERPLRFYCHVCDVEFQSVASNFTCPHCSDGFIEELQGNEDQAAASVNFPANGDPWSLNPWENRGNELLHAITGTVGRENDIVPGERQLTRSASSNLRPPFPIEHLVHDFIINLGVGVNLGNSGNFQLFLGNPGDYAWGREGLDTIVTQFLNQMEPTGPPPLSKAVIDALQLVEVTEEQVGLNMQCSVCWEHFQLKEEVRQLPCLHIYHDNCIRPWLQLHGTCPICRQDLGGNGEDGRNSSEDTSNLEVPDMIRTLLGATTAQSAPPGGSQMDQSGSGNNRTSNGDPMI